MSFIDTLLEPGESVVKRTRLSWFGFAAQLASGALLGAGVLLGCWYAGYSLAAGAAGAAVVLAVFLFLPILQRRFDEFAVTDRRIMARTGIISRNIFEMRLAKVESVDISQNILERMFDCGTISISGTGDTTRKISMIEEPFAFRQAINQAMAARRED